MPIAPADLEYRLSGGAANADPNASLGGAMSSTPIVSGATDNLFDDVAGAEAQVGDAEFRAFYVRNKHSTLTWQLPVYWIASQVSPAGSSFDIALASEGVSFPIAQTLSDEGSVPTGVTFTSPLSKSTGLQIANVPPGGYKGLWIRRTVAAGASAADSVGSIRVEGDSGP